VDHLAVIAELSEQTLNMVACPNGIDMDESRNRLMNKSTLDTTNIPTSIIEIFMEKLYEFEKYSIEIEKNLAELQRLIGEF
jgi:translation initiation factor 2B subunit (eIF-2B alpha/beta/delta family)